MSDTWRGHAIAQVAPDVWAYAATGQLVRDNPNIDCGHCGKPNTPEGHDACLGTLAGVANACCGHGDPKAAYVQLGSKGDERRARPGAKAMSGKPISFSGPMVRAIIDGRKNQTRRLARLNAAGRVVRGKQNWHPDDPEAVLACPYGQPGTKLWVKESWATQDNGPDEYPTIMWRADMAAANYAGPPDPARWKSTPPGSRSDIFCLSPDHPVLRWRSSRCMPRWASRLTLEITQVRLERLHDITCWDIRAEGVSCPEHDFHSGFCSSECPTLREAFRDIWDSINAKRAPYASNPLVWAVTFGRVET